MSGFRAWLLGVLGGVDVEAHDAESGRLAGQVHAAQLEADRERVRRAAAEDERDEVRADLESARAELASVERAVGWSAADSGARLAAVSARVDSVLAAGPAALEGGVR